eukprot:6188731-Pleurochrysis_carterae.AAC.2
MPLEVFLRRCAPSQGRCSLERIRGGHAPSWERDQQADAQSGTASPRVVRSAARRLSSRLLASCRTQDAHTLALLRDTRTEHE